MGYTRYIFRTTCLHTELPLHNNVNNETIFVLPQIKMKNTVDKWNCTQGSLATHKLPYKLRTDLHWVLFDK